MTLKEYSFQVEYIRGSENTIADILSRVSGVANDQSPSEQDLVKGIPISLPESPSIRPSTLQFMPTPQSQMSPSPDFLAPTDSLHTLNCAVSEIEPEQSHSFCSPTEDEHSSAAFQPLGDPDWSSLQNSDPAIGRILDVLTSGTRLTA